MPNPKHGFHFLLSLNTYISKFCFSIYIKSVYIACSLSVFPYNISLKFNWMLVCFITSTYLILSEHQKARWSTLFFAYDLFKYFWAKQCQWLLLPLKGLSEANSKDFSLTSVPFIMLFPVIPFITLSIVRFKTPVYVNSILWTFQMIWDIICFVSCCMLF